MRSFVVATCVVSVAGHGSLVSPRPRNSIDYLVNVNTQPCANITGGKCENGQASFWYSQGCFIGCSECDHKSGRVQYDLCGNGFKATINAPKYRSVNRNATAGSPEDVYKHNPWRAPGNAPVANPCGLAGGTPWANNVGEAGDYTKTKYAHHGMQGTDLPAMPTGTVWKIGGEAEVSWQVRNNHGGGYQYRLCPASENLTEACFQQHPLEFVQEKAGLVFSNGTKIAITGTFVNKGTSPAGSTWAMIPIPPTWLGPRCKNGPTNIPAGKQPGPACESWEGHNRDGTCEACPQTPGSDCSRCDNNGVASFPPHCEENRCQGVDATDKNGSVAAFDVVKVPKLPPGKYVLGWRYDCEATAQVWSNCADITLEA